MDRLDVLCLKQSVSELSLSEFMELLRLKEAVCKLTWDELLELESMRDEKQKKRADRRRECSIN